MCIYRKSAASIIAFVLLLSGCRVAVGGPHTSNTSVSSPSVSSPSVSQPFLTVDENNVGGANLDSWIGEYAFFENAPDAFFIKIYSSLNLYYAQLWIDGYKSKVRVLTTVRGDKGSILMSFEEYLSDTEDDEDGWYCYKFGDVLLRFERKDSDVLTYWEKLTPLRLENREPGFYFKEIQAISSNSANNAIHFYMTQDGWYRYADDGTKLRICDEKYTIVTVDDYLFYRGVDGLYSSDLSNVHRKLDAELPTDIKANDGWLYFSSKNGVYKMKFDGSDRTQLVGGECNKVAVTKDFVFYSVYDVPDFFDSCDDGPSAPCGRLFRIDSDGNGCVDLELWVLELDAYNNQIYFTNARDGILYKMEPDSREMTVFYESISYVDNLRFYEGYALFTNPFFIVRQSVCSREHMILFAFGWCHIVNVIDGYIYFYNWAFKDTDTENNGYARVRLDGSGFERIY